jgi:hypothetical protein
MKFRGSLLFFAALAVTFAIAAERDETPIQKQIQRIKETDANGWRKIPWTPSLLAARQASGREKQPIFLFTHDGNIQTGRC